MRKVVVGLEPRLRSCAAAPPPEEAIADKLACLEAVQGCAAFGDSRHDGDCTDTCEQRRAPQQSGALTT